MRMAVNIDNELLISLVEERPVLWDKTLDIYKDRNATKNAWIEICCELKDDFESMDNRDKDKFSTATMRRWANLRDAFSRYLKKKKKCDAAAEPIKKYVYYDRMQFIAHHLLCKETEDSMEIVGNMKERLSDKEYFQFHQVTTDKKKMERSASRKRRESDEVEVKMPTAPKQPEIQNPHLAFFQGLLPHLEKFDEDEILEFQMSALQTIADIRGKRKWTQGGEFEQR